MEFLLYWAFSNGQRILEQGPICAAKANAPVHPTHQDFPFAHCTEINPAKGKTIHEIRHDPVIPAYDKVQNCPMERFPPGPGVLDGTDWSRIRCTCQHRAGRIPVPGPGRYAGEAGENSPNHWKSSVSTMRVSSSPRASHIGHTEYSLIKASLWVQHWQSVMSQLKSFWAWRLKEQFLDRYNLFTFFENRAFISPFPAVFPAVIRSYGTIIAKGHPKYRHVWN